MVLLQNKNSSRKRGASNSFVSPFPQQQPPKIPKHNNQNDDVPPHQTLNPLHTLASVLADAGCTLINSAGPPYLPPERHKLRHLLHRRFSADAALRSDFLTSLSAYIDSTHNLRRVLQPSHGDSYGASKNDSLVRVLLLVPSIQLDLQKMLLEKLPLYFDAEPVGGFGSSTSSRLDEDVARLIINQLRWLDFLVDSEVFTEKLLEVLSICPLHLKKEIIGSLPEIIGDQNNNTVINSLEQMLQNDSNAIIVPVLDCVTNFNLDDLLLEKVTTLALSYVRTIDAEHMPYLLKFLLLSATPMNAQKIISKIREQLKNLGVSNISSTQHNKLKGKSVAENVDSSILDALRSSLRFKNMLCQELLKELKGLDKPQDHKVIDIWLLMLIYMNSEFMQKIVEKMFKKKVVEGCINAAMFEQCICGNKQLVQDFFASFLSLSEYLLASKEPKAREFSIHMYKCLFEVFVDNYSRQEILGAIVTHVGSGNSFEVDSALEVMTLLASNYSRELLPLSSHISGILDYSEGFNVQSLHTVYEVFCLLALSARCSGETFGSSIANELLMIVRKQVSNPDLKYKRMGVIGSLKIVSFLGDVNNTHCLSSSQKSNTEEALELLKTSMDSCKQLPLPSIIFYDELIATLDRKVLHPDILEWIGKYVAEFESRFLYDLDVGKLSVKESYCGLEGELWMNLDGDISPICLNILPLVSSSTQSVSFLQVLPAHFLLLSKIESLTNQGSLGGIDALLGCPLHLPSSKLFTESTWQSMSEKQKHILCLCLYYAANWMRELINAFCTQVAGRLDRISQTNETEIITKLLKRLRNLVCLESLLNNSIKKCHISFPQLYPHDLPSSSLLSQSSYKVAGKTNVSGSESSSQKRKVKNQRTSKASSKSDTNGTSRQPTIMEVLRKAGAVPSQDLPNEDSTGMSIKENASASSLHVKSSEPEYIDISMASKSLEVQRLKFRPLLVDCFSILSFSQKLDPCCADPAAELPLRLYLLRDLHCKLEYFSPSGKQSSSRCLNSPPGFSGMTAVKFLRKIRSLFPTLREHLDCAIRTLKEGDEACEEHWKVQSALAGNPDISNIVVSKTSVSSSVFIEILHCFSKMLNIPDTLMDKSILSDLLQSFQPGKILDDIFAGMLLIPSSGSIDYLYLGAYSFLEEALDVATVFSFTLASEVLLSMESVVTSVRKFLDKPQEEDGKCKRTEKNGEVLPVLCSRLGIAAQKLLRHNWDIDRSENSWKRKGDLVQRTVHIYLENCESTSDLLDELAQSILPKVSLCRTTDVDDSHGFPTLCSATFVVWYRELHEENLTILNKLVKEAVSAENQRGSVNEETTEKLLHKLRQSVNVVVSLVNLCKVHDKVSVHAMSIKYGGKFVDSFLKVFDFLQTQFEKHNEFIIEMIKELQKATRTIQTLCSEAKSLKQTLIASKIPATKRSMERFLFQVKALFHTTARGCTFWMGNLKHKDLMGQVVSSQPYIGDEDVNIDDEPDDSVLDDQPATVANDEDSEVE